MSWENKTKKKPILAINNIREFYGNYDKSAADRIKYGTREKHCNCLLAHNLCFGDLMVLHWQVFRQYHSVAFNQARVWP